MPIKRFLRITPVDASEIATTDAIARIRNITAIVAAVISIDLPYFSPLGPARGDRPGRRAFGDVQLKVVPSGRRWLVPICWTRELSTLDSGIE
jgi:hypothetical protein